MIPRRFSDHGADLALLGVIAVGVMGVMCFGLYHATKDDPFDPSAYLVVLTLIVGAVKERWTQRSVDRMGEQLQQSAPAPSDPSKTEVTQ